LTIGKGKDIFPEFRGEGDAAREEGDLAKVPIGTYNVGFQ
jgi:hypothetical protein